MRALPLSIERIVWLLKFLSNFERVGGEEAAIVVVLNSFVLSILIHKYKVKLQYPGHLN